MGCNAWNHPPECSCGWGGEFGAARSTKNALHWPTVQGSYLNPNALCKKCGASVFFYRSANGGSVLFDSLGPPWPKHPCATDNFTDEIPTSAYWQAREILDKNFVRGVPRAILTGSDTKFASWILNQLIIQVRNGQLRPTLAMWISVLPPIAVGGSNIDLLNVNLAKITSIAKCVSHHFSNPPRDRWKNVCWKIALVVLEINTERDTKRIAVTCEK